MGYTHYWHRPRDGAYERAFKLAKKIAEHGKSAGILGGWDGTGEPVINDDEIRFNGIGEESCETFVLPATLEKLSDFNFCKTRQFPYDAYVTAILWLVSHVIPVTSDGDMEGDEWAEGRALVEEITPGWYSVINARRERIHGD